MTNDAAGATSRPQDYAGAVRRALITGITGQDGSYLAELLLDKGYEVHGLVRRSSVVTRWRIDHLRDNPRLQLHYGDLIDAGSLVNLVAAVRPHEVYNLAAMSHVRVSFEMPDFTHTTNALGTERLLEAVHSAGLDCRFFQASSSEMFGSTPPPQNEDSSFHPRSPYGVSKAHAHWAAVNHREARGMFVVSGIMFNHESPRRGENFVTRKITKAVAAIEAGVADHVELGNLDPVRDWGYAPEYVEGMWLMLQADEPVDYVLATGTGHSVRDFCAAAFGCAGMDWRDYVTHNDAFERPAEVEAVVGDPSRVRAALGWKARTVLPEIAEIMVASDREEIRRLLRG